MDSQSPERVFQRNRDAHLMIELLDRCVTCFEKYLNTPESRDIKADWKQLREELLPEHRAGHHP